LKAGNTEEQVLQYFVKDVGGIHVLSEPPDKGFNRLAWAVPYAVGLGSFAAIGLVALRWSRRRDSAEDLAPRDEATSALEARLDEELRDLD